MALTVNKFSGTAPAGAVTTTHDSATFNNSSEIPYIQTSGVGSGEVTISSLGTYDIDIFGDIKSYNPKDTPLLTIIANVGGEAIDSPEFDWIDEYEGDAWVDIKIDDLRESVRNSATSIYSGRLAFESVTTLPAASTDAAFGGSALTELALASGNLLTLGFNTSSDNIRGKKEEVIRKLANTLNIFSYTLTSTGLGDSKTYHKYAYASGTSSRVYMAFDDLAIKCGSICYEKHEVIVGIDAFYYDTAYGELIIVLDFDDSNISDILDSTATDNTVLLEEVSTGTGTAFSANYTGYYTRFSRLALIGNVYDVPAGIAEGSSYSDGGNFIFGQDMYANYTQIFDSPKYGITGTRQATKIRFKDDWQASRRRHLVRYKNKIAAACMFGAQSRTFDNTTGLPKRTMSGIFDYGMFPIRYIRKPIPDIATGTPVGTQLATWLDDISYSLNAFKQMGSDANTLLVSKEVIKKLRDWAAYIGTTSGNVFGATFQTTPPSSMTLGLEVTEWTSNYGVLRFIEDPSLNFMPKFPYSVNSATAGSSRGGAPVHLFSSGINPRNLMLSIDKAHIQFLTLRPDKIEGNIQNPGQDMFQEAMRGEHSLRMRFPRNHAVIVVE